MSTDEKILVGGLILNHLVEFLDDPYIFEDQFCNFLQELILTNKKERINNVFRLFHLLLDR